MALNSTSHVITIDENIAEVDERELKTYARLRRLIEQAKQKKRQEVNGQGFPPAVAPAVATAVAPAVAPQSPPQSGQPSTGGQLAVNGQQSVDGHQLLDVSKEEVNRQPPPPSWQPSTGSQPAVDVQQPAVTPAVNPAVPAVTPAVPAVVTLLNGKRSTGGQIAVNRQHSVDVQQLELTNEQGNQQPLLQSGQLLSQTGQFLLQTDQLISQSGQPPSEPAFRVEDLPAISQSNPQLVQPTLQPVQLTGELQPVANGQQPRELTKEEVVDLEDLIYSKEKQNRVQSRTLSITTGDTSGELALQTEQFEVTKVLPHSYKLIRNLLWIEKNPVYKKALAEWEAQEKLFASKVDRRIKRSGDFRNEIYNVLGYYSVFQGVLLTASSQSNYLHCLNVGLPIALSAFASVGTLAHISRKFWMINDYERTIGNDMIALQEVSKRKEALKEQGEAFRFNDFLEKGKKTSSQPGFKSFAKSSLVAWAAIFLFSLLFVLSHPLILCRPGPK